MLGAYQYRFARDLDALQRHLVDATHDWKTLGLDLLDGAPDHITAPFARHGYYPSAAFDNVITTDGSPAGPSVITEDATGYLDWGYILHEHGIEVIALPWYDRGPIVGWDTSPLAPISDDPRLWAPGRPAPVQAPRTPPPITTSPPQPAATPAPSRSASR